jgi:outer membrane protein OmpA-like peptidoglycan-associated protein
MQRLKRPAVDHFAGALMEPLARNVNSMIGNAQKRRAVNKLNRPVGGSRQKPKTPVLGAGNRHRAEPLKLPGTLQAKLTMGKANDAFEQEADRVASEVMRMPNAADVGSLDHAGTAQLQRKCSCASQEGGCDKCREERLSLKRCDAGSRGASEIPASVHEVLSSSGQPLDSATRAFMEPRFGYDFSDVRVHANAIAARSAREVSALAFTVGNHIAFAAGQYVPGTSKTNSLLAHELTHVVQQGGAGARSARSQDTVADVRDKGAGSQVSGVIQRAGDPAAIPLGFACPTDLLPGRPAGTDILFPTGGATVTATHTAQLRTFVAAWVAAGGTDEITVHGYASTVGDEGPNWTLSCDRAQNVHAALLALGVPSVHLRILAHGESTDFGASNGPNQHAVVSSSPGGLFSTPIVSGTFTANDEFPGRSHTRFGVDELMFLGFTSLPSRPAADFGGLVWVLISGGGSLLFVNPDGSAMYRAPDRAATVQFELRVASGPTAGRVVASPIITIVEPNSVRMVAVPGTAPGFSASGTIPSGEWGAGFLADVFIGPNDVSFLGVVFGEGVVAAVVTPPGSFLSPVAGRVHPLNTFGPGGPGNIATGTPLSPVRDQVSIRGFFPTGTFLGLATCGNSDLNFAIPWEFSVGGGARKGFDVANSHRTSNFFCHATTEKAGAGPFCRRINGTTC